MPNMPLPPASQRYAAPPLLPLPPQQPRLRLPPASERHAAPPLEYYAYYGQLQQQPQQEGVQQIASRWQSGVESFRDGVGHRSARWMTAAQMYGHVQPWEGSTFQSLRRHSQARAQRYMWLAEKKKLFANGNRPQGSAAPSAQGISFGQQQQMGQVPGQQPQAGLQFFGQHYTGTQSQGGGHGPQLQQGAYQPQWQQQQPQWQQPQQQQQQQFFGQHYT